MNETTAIAQGQLRTLVERIERLEEERAAMSADLREIYAEAKAQGFDAKVLRRVVRARKQDRVEREQEDALFDLYLHALGMHPETGPAG